MNVLFYLFSTLLLVASVYASDGVNPDPPASPARLVFIHHSVGEGWLIAGELRQALNDNNYYVTDTNYGWGPESIGDNTDIGHWYNWFLGTNRDTYLDALYTNNHITDGVGPNSISDPGGSNTVVMFKSCYPNGWVTAGNPEDPPLPEGEDNPIWGEWSGSEAYTVSNIKGLYRDLLDYFATRQDKLFILITTSPSVPSIDEGVDETTVARHRGVCSWLVNDWLTDYPHNNVFVFDYYNVLTSNGGDQFTNDLGAVTGNHHRFRNNQIEHVIGLNNNFHAYDQSGDNHPTAEGHQKATGEFLPLLNIAYNRWQGTGPLPPSITITSPNGGEAWCGESSHNITWTTTGSGIDHVHLLYSTDSGGIYQDIVASTPNDGTYGWTIPPIDSSTVRVQAIAEDASNSALADDESNANFTIQVCAIPGTVLLVDFGASEGANTFGLAGWNTAFTSPHTDYTDAGPDGTTMISGDDEYDDYQGVMGAPPIELQYGHQIAVTWYNNSGEEISFVPLVSFEDTDSPVQTEGEPQWYGMTRVTIPAGGTGQSTYDIYDGSTGPDTGISAGVYSLVNVCVRSIDLQNIAVCDRIELNDDVDTVPPSQPQNLLVSTELDNAIALSWDASTDNVGVMEYHIYYQSGTYVGKSSTTSFTDYNVQPETDYTYTVTAVDAKRNESGHSLPATGTTLAFQGSASLIDPSTDMDYLGAFRLPAGGDAPNTWDYGGFGMTYYPNGDPGNVDGDTDFPGSIYGFGHMLGPYVSEISIPTPVISPTKNVDDLNTATTLQGFHDIRPYPEDVLLPMVDIEYLPRQRSQTTDKLYAFFGDNYIFEKIPTHFACELDLSNPQSVGKWYIGSTTGGIYGQPSLFSYIEFLFGIPQAWSDANTPGQLLISGGYREGGLGGLGPAMFAIGPWNDAVDGTLPPPNTELTYTRLLQYGEDFAGINTINGHAYGRELYVNADRWTGGAFLTAGDKSAVVVIGTRSLGECWYGYSDGTQMGEDDADWNVPWIIGTGDKGYYAASTTAQFIFYDPDELAAVANGTMESYEPQPYTVLNVDGYLFHQSVEPGSDRVRTGAASFDRQRGLLYVFEPHGYDWANVLVHVWRVSAAPPVLGINLTSPNGGEVWCGGSSHNITWTTTGSGIDHVHLLYSTDSGGSYQDIIASTANDGTYEWTIPQTSSSTVRVQAIAEDASNSALADDESNANFTIQLPGIGVTPTSLTFSAVAGGSNPSAQTLNITNTGCGTLNWTVSDDADWLSMSPVSGNCTSETDGVTVSANIAGLASGTHNGTITISATGASNSPQTVAVTLNIQPVSTEDLIMQAYSPVDVVVTDPMGRTISKSTNEIPSASYDERDLNGDGDMDDEVTIPDPLLGDYSIEVVAEAGADPTDTYTLDVILGDETTRLADSVQVQNIPSEPYEFFFPQRNMESGWNLISVPVQLPNYAIEVALQSIISNCSSVWTYETTDTGGEWRRYVRNAPAFLSNLGTIQAEKGYWVLMADPDVLTLDGDEEAVASIQWEQGWNLVGYDYLKAWPVGQIKPENCDAVWTYDAGDGVWERYIEGGSDNDLVWMKPGEGYWMHISGGAPPAPVWSPMVSTDRPGIPYTIWGSIEANGVNMTRSMWPGAPTVILKIDDTVKARYRLGEVAQYGDHYVLDIPETTDCSAQAELYVQFEDTVTKAASIPPGQPGQIIRLDLYVRIIPKVSLLYQNYPNPFNPDTWIPYQMKEDAHVVIKIYTATGQHVRTLDLGHKQAGFYTTRERAAHWDGRNEASEHVASGVYFYTIQAGDYSATRKMLVVQ